ncbi:MAG: DamH [Candidatus Daviesbacteria bacterium GW2011_GWB1_41_5]|uniref:site-specific DNA-methyltransferase (adenine-specific) n=1 Tax=Candidatus Daviesbacteria bacterium GW2011_GWB1_41_5 TaxID=1618429 RepID=A0A0G0ZE28_9BACT|nr:MAG: DamH [Candidatus Daviesbacteria bacterium GW2011_GWB1_41_5]
MQQPKFPKVNFIGNKDGLSAWICSYFPSDTKVVFDAFSGGGSVGYEAKKQGFKVITNDILKTNMLLATALIENQDTILDENDLETLFSGQPIKGFMYREYSNVYFFPEECMQLDQYRENVEKLSSKYKKALALSLLRRSMIRKMPYSRFTINWETIKRLRDEAYSYEKYGRKRAYHNQSFKEHILEAVASYNEAVFDNSQENLAYNVDIFEVLGKVKADVVYLDPPYSGTMNNYFGFYGVLDEYFASKKLKPFENNFVDKKKALYLFDKLFSSLGSYKYWFMSYNNSSYPSKEELVKLLEKYSDSITVVEKPHKYKLTNKENKEKNKEYLFIVKNLHKNFRPVMFQVDQPALCEELAV